MSENKKYKKVAVPNFPYQAYTQVWDSTGKRSNIQLPTQIISSIADYIPKDGSIPTDGSPAYTTVFDSSTKTFYLVPIYSGLDAVKETVEENLDTPAPAATSTPTRSSLQAARRAVTAPRRLPISSMPANVQQYVDHVDENGNVFFRLPEGVTNNQVQEALRLIQPQVTSLNTPLYESTPAQNSSNSLLNTNNRLNITREGNNNIREAEGQRVLTGSRYNIYAYPLRQVDVYNIHPDVYAQVLEQLLTQTGLGGQQNNRYLISTTPLSVPNGMANDSTYHYIGKDLADETINIPADMNTAYFNGLNTVYVLPNIRLNESDVTNNRVIGKVTARNTDISNGRSNGNTFVALPEYGKAYTKRTVVESNRRIPSNYTSSDFRGDGSLTAAQEAAYYNNLDRRWVSGYLNGVLQGDATASEIINSIPSENALPAEEEPRRRGNIFLRVGDFFGFNKQGGTLNYFLYLQDGGEVKEKRGLSRFVDHEKADTSPHEIDNYSSPKEIAHGLSYMIPGYGTYLSVKDAIADPTWFNIGSAALSGLGDLAMLTGFGVAGKALVTGTKALKAAKFAKAADKGLQAGKAMRLIDNGKLVALATELAGIPKGAINIATHGEGKFLLGGEMNYFSFLKSGGGIHIKPENKGKFTATKKRTGKTTEELTHSKNPITRKRAIFALNAAKWNHKK